MVVRNSRSSTVAVGHGLLLLSVGLVSCRAGIEDLREKREEVNRQILRDEEEKAKVQRVRRCWRCCFLTYGELTGVPVVAPCVELSAVVVTRTLASVLGTSLRVGCWW